MHHTQSVDAERFLAQNTLVAESITDADTKAVEDFAEHHAGGLYVLGRPVGDGRYIKLHDSWGDDEMIVVHAYDPNDQDDESESETYYANGSDAVAAFLTFGQ